MGPAAKAAWAERARGILAGVRISPRAVLDFGAGQGHFVHALREMGIAAEGVESSPSGRAAARRLYNIELRSQISADLRGQFQLVTLSYSLEHVVNPVATLAEAVSLLERTGMVFIEVPHASSIEMWKPHRRREILDLPLHLYHFSPVTLFRVVERAGLRVVDVQLSNRDVVEWLLHLRACGSVGSAEIL